MSEGITYTEVRRLVDNLYHQLEAFISVQQVLQPRLPLPPMRNWVVCPDFGVLLITELLRSTPRSIVELGSGVTTLLTAYCLERNGQGQLISLEHDKHYLETTRRFLRDHGLSEYADIVHAPLENVRIEAQDWKWYGLSSLSLPENSVDLLVVDGPPGVTQKMARFPALPALRRYLKPEATILLDDAAREDEKAIVEQWLSLYPGAQAEYITCEKGASVVHLSGESL